MTIAVRGAVGTITMRAGRTGNALDLDLQQALAEACEVVDADERVRVVVLAGAGRRFCTGLPAGCRWPPPEWPDAVAAVAGVRKPILAAVTGDARGWGMALALACDLRVMATTAALELPAPVDGGFPGGGVTQRITRLIGPGRASRLLMLGGRLSARRAAAWGVADRIATPARVPATTAALARRIAGHGPLAVCYAKEAIQRALDLPLDDGIRLEHDLYVLLQTTADRREGVRAFVERRRPDFRGH